MLVAGTPLAVWMLFIHPEWAAEWMTLATLHRWNMIITGSLLITVAAWYAGREHRQDTRELLDSTPLPRWRRHLLMLSTLLTAAVVAHLLAFAVAGAFVIRQTDYLGGGWWWIVLLSCVGLFPLAGLGWLVGTVFPSRLTAPLAGVSTYLGIGFATWDDDPWQELLPTGRDNVSVGMSPTTPIVIVALVFLVLSGVGLLLLVLDEQHRVWGPLALVGAAAMLFSVRGTEEPWWWTPDTEATAPVCADTEPEVCVWRTHAKFLDSTAAAISPPLQRLGDLAPSQAREQDPYEAHPDPDVLEIYLYAQIPLTGRELLRPGEVRRQAQITPLWACDLAYKESEQHEEVWTADSAVTEILFGDFDDEVWYQPPAGVARLRDATERQRQEFVSTFYELARECDLEALDALVTTWSPN
jgi:hypothetical protein